MKDIAIYTLTSALHDEKAVAAATREFLGTLGFDYDFREADFTDFGAHALSLLYVRTGGTEGIFRQLFPRLASTQRKFFLLTSGKSNSLAASMEILSFLRQQGIAGEILHGSADYITRRVLTLARVAEALRSLRGQRLGIIGQPSDWLIASSYSAEAVQQLLGIELVPVAIDRLTQLPPTPGMQGAERIYDELRDMVAEHRLDGFTLRCFDLLTTVHNTGCLALARLNAEGTVASCEGDVPAMLSMKIAQALTGVTGFQANPASIDPETGRMVLAHCTIPLSMVERYELDTHFESGIGVGIRGYMKPGPVTIFKTSGDLSRHFVAEGMLVENQSKPDLCRTQQLIELADKTLTGYFLNNPIGNHHIVVPGCMAQLVDELMAQF